MSQQQVLQKSIENYQEYFEKQIQQKSNEAFVYKYYTRNELDYDKVAHALFMSKIMCEDVCELTTYINNKIAGELEPCKKKRCLSDTIKEYKNYHNQEHCSDQEIIGRCTILTTPKW